MIIEERMTVGRLERSLRPFGLVAPELSVIILFFALLIYTGNAYLAIFSAIVITAIPFTVATLRLREKTGRWWFVKYYHYAPGEPIYDTPLGDFFGTIEQELENQQG